MHSRSYLFQHDELEETVHVKQSKDKTLDKSFNKSFNKSFDEYSKDLFYNLPDTSEHIPLCPTTDDLYNCCNSESHTMNHLYHSTPSTPPRLCEDVDNYSKDLYNTPPPSKKGRSHSRTINLSAEVAPFNPDKFVYCSILYGKINDLPIENIAPDISNMRKFHNYIKYQIITTNSISANATTLLDIACGRGGDINKWLHNDVNLKYIFAFDSHYDSIYNSIQKGHTYDGAIERFKKIKIKIKKKIPYINFQNLNILTPDIINKINNIDNSKIYDIVSCQFAMNYFCENVSTLDSVIKIVSQKLRPNGLFFGTAVDGNLVFNILKKGNIHMPLLTLIHNNKSNYIFNINTKETNEKKDYFQIKGTSSEYYLFKDQLEQICIQNNLTLIKYTSFFDYYQDYKLDDNLKLNMAEMLISFLNFTFIFKKN